LTLAEMADHSVAWPGIRETSSHPIRLVLAGTAARFDSLTGSRVPAWSAGVTFPATNTIVVKLKGDPRQALRHELAHLALHSAVQRVPRWFDEGYAAVAAGEWDRLDVLRVNWALAKGDVPTFDQMDADLEGGAARAEAAYALAASAVQFLQRIDDQRGLAPLISTLGHTADFDAALRQTHAVTLEQLEELWRRDLKRRYGWLSFLSSITIFWAGIGALLAAAWAWRRRRDRERRLALDQGWELPPEDDDPTA